MQCNKCFSRPSSIYLDCYCIFCRECFESEVSDKLYQVSKKSGGKGICPFCQKSTFFKRCDSDIPSEQSTIKQLTSRPELSLLKAVETTKFNLLQLKRQNSFLSEQVTFLLGIIEHIGKRIDLQNCKFTEEMKNHQSFYLVERLFSKHRAFELLDRPSSPLPKPLSKKNISIERRPQQKEPLSPINNSRDSLDFKLKSIRDSSRSKETLNIRDKQRLQNILIESSGFSTPIHSKRAPHWNYKRE